jgi:hypothetical protein
VYYAATQEVNAARRVGVRWGDDVNDLHIVWA